MKQYIFLLAAAMLATACSRQDFYEVPVMPGTDTPIENPTRLTVTLAPESSATEGIVVRLLPADNAEGSPLAYFAPAQTVDVEADTYRILGVTDPATLTGASLQGAVLNLTNGTSASSRAATVVPTAPDVHAAATLATLPPNADNRHTLTLAPHTRPLQCSLMLQGIDAADVASARFELSGVRSGADLSLPFSPASGKGNATLTHTLTDFATTPEGLVEATATVRLLGIDTASGQTLTLTIALKDGSTQTVSYDVTALLSGFYGTTETKPATLDAVVSFGIDNVTGSIDGWTPGVDEDVAGE